MGVIVRSLLLVLWGMVAHASIVADPGAAPSNTPTVGAAGNGTQVIDIVATNGAGVSHNKFSEFDIGAQGAILNNSTLAIQPTNLGGLITGNPNLAGQTASLIINEITSTNPSVLNGFLEVAGQGADVVVANPNGITCKGCGFINTPRATLTTGVPQSNPTTGALQTLDVDNGIVTISDAGATASNYFDIIARSVDLLGQINANNLGVYLGRNSFDYGTKTPTKKPSNGSTKPILAIDASALGAMNAGAITILATEDGVGVNMPSSQASIGDIVVTADGGIEIGNSRAAGKTTIESKKSSIKATSLLSESDVTLKAPEVDISQGIVASGAADSTGTNNPAKLTILTDKLNLVQSSLFTSNGGEINTYSGARTRVDNSSSSIYSIGDFIVTGLSYNQYMSAYDLQNTQAFNQTNNYKPRQSYIDYYTTTSQDSFTALDSPPWLFVDGNLTMDLDNVSNKLGAIWASGLLDFKSSSLDNQNLNLYRTFEQKSILYSWECKSKRKKILSFAASSPKFDHVAKPQAISLQDELIDTVYSTIYGASGVLGSIDSIINTAINNSITAQVADFKKNFAITSMPSFMNQGLYQISPLATYLYETRPDFVDVSKFVNSSGFLAKFPPPNNITQKLLGDGYAQQQYIRAQLLSMSGLMVLPGYNTYNDLITALLANADTFATATGTPTGIKLTQAQADALMQDIIWLEEETVGGVKVLVPKVYLSGATKSSLARRGAVIQGGSLSLAASSIYNGGTMLSSSIITLGAQDITNSGDIKSTLATSIIASGTTTNLGSVFGSTVDISADKILNQTAKERKYYAYGFEDMLGPQATINSSAGTTLNSTSDISNTGIITSAGDTQITAGVDVYNISETKERMYSYAGRRKGASSYSLTNQAAIMDSGGLTKVVAGGYVYNTGSNISGNTGDIEAGKPIISKESVDVAQSTSWFKNRNVFYKKSASNNTETTIVNKSSLNFTNGYTLRSGIGDTILQATDLTSSGAGVHENPAGGTVYSAAISGTAIDKSVNKKNLARYKNVGYGSYTESLTSGTTNVQGGITYLSSTTPITQSLLANSSSYYHKQKGFTHEFATFGGIVASVATMGAASGIGLAATSALGLQGAMGIAVQNATAVGMSSIASNITSNSILNSNLSRGAKDTFRRDGIKSIAASSLSAGATGGIASSMGVKIDNYTIRPVSTTDIIHRATYAAINTGTQTATDVALLHKKFGKSLTDNIRSNVAIQAQATGAFAIGAAYADRTIGYTEHKLAHAGLGAAAGAVAAGKPLAGALGAVTAEVVGESAFMAGTDPYQAADLAKVSGAAMGLVSGDVNTAANSAATVAENNLVPFMATAAANAARTCAMNPACASLVRDGVAIGVAMAATGIAKNTEGFDIADALQKLPGFNPEQNEPSVLATPEADRSNNTLATPMPNIETASESKGFEAVPDWLKNWGSALFNKAVRPTAKQSEVDVGKDLGEAAKYQKSFKGGNEVRYGLKGSVRPDYCIGNICSIEVKNYDINKNSAKLIDNIAKQAIKRKAELKEGMVQEVKIDVRGQKYTAQQLDGIRKEIDRKSNGIIPKGKVKFIER